MNTPLLTIFVIFSSLPYFCQDQLQLWGVDGPDSLLRVIGHLCALFLFFLSPLVTHHPELLSRVHAAG